MKAKVKATGEIIEIEPTFVDGNKVYSWVTDNGYFYPSGSLDFETITQENTDVKEESLPKDEPDYWDKLYHQAAIAAMQGVLSNTKLMDILGMQKGRELDEMVANLSLKHATALVEKLKNE